MRAWIPHLFLLGALLALAGCATAKAVAANGEDIHAPGATRERCLHWMLDGRHDINRWRMILDEIEAEPPERRADIIEEASAKLQAWPDALRRLPRHWHPEDLEANPEMLTLVRHLDGSRLSPTWRVYKANALLPGITRLTIAHQHHLVTLLEELDKTPGAYPKLRTLRLTKNMPEVLVERLLGTALVSRVEGIELSIRATPKITKALATAHLPRLRALEWRGPVNGRPDSKEAFAALLRAPWLRGLHQLHLPYAKLGDQRVIELLTALGRPSKLKVLDLSYNILRGPAIEALAKTRGLYGLTTLKLRGAHMNLEAAKALARPVDMNNLEVLDLSNTRLRDDGAAWLGRSKLLAHIRSLNLSNNRISDVGFKEFLWSRSLGPLEELVASNNGLGPSAGAVLGRSKAMKTLRRVHLSNVKLRDDGAALWFSQTQGGALRELVLERNQLTAASLRSMKSAPFARKIELLNLSNNPLGDAGIKALTAIPMYPRVVKLGRARIGDVGVKMLLHAQMMRLVESIDLRSNAWTHKGAAVLGSGVPIERLSALNLKNNKLGSPENLIEMAWSPMSLHMHRPRLSFDEVDIGVEDVKEFEDPDAGKIATVLARFAHVPQLGERFVKSPYLSASMRRDMAFMFTRTLNFMEGPKGEEKVPAAVRFLIVGYVTSMKNINDTFRGTGDQDRARDRGEMIKWGSGWLKEP